MLRWKACRGSEMELYSFDIRTTFPLPAEKNRCGGNWEIKKNLRYTTIDIASYLVSAIFFPGEPKRANVICHLSNSFGGW